MKEFPTNTLKAFAWMGLFEFACIAGAIFLNQAWLLIVVFVTIIPFGVWLFFILVKEAGEGAEQSAVGIWAQRQLDSAAANKEDTAAAPDRKMPGWYPHPEDPKWLAYWDGREWTEMDKKHPNR